MTPKLNILAIFIDGDEAKIFGSKLVGISKIAGNLLL
jgi:hypothetical protein